MNEVDTILRKQIDGGLSPSVHYIIFNENKVIHKFLGGFAHLKNQKKTSENTAYHLFSITKTFTALAILQLAEQEKLHIDQFVKEHLPEFPYGSEITIRQLMSHSAGIPNPIPLSWIHLPEEHQSFDSTTFFNHIYAKNSKVKARPNEKFGYSNLGYVLLGQLIEKVSGLPYEEYINIHILKPSGIMETEMGFTIPHSEQCAKGYHKRFGFSNLILVFLMDKSKFMAKPEGKWVPFKENYVNGTAYGGLIGTPYSLVKYAQALLKPNSQLISDDYKQMLFTENFTNQNKATGMCLSWFTGELNGHRYVTHAGGGGGYYCEIRLYPEKGIGSVILFNRSGMRDERFLDKLDEHFLKNKNRAS